MRRPASIFAALVIVGACHPAQADDLLAGKDFVTSPVGQPFCTERDQLAEYIFAMASKDARRLEMLDSCATVHGGLTVHVIRDFEGSDVGHVVKARVTGPQGSMVAYTLSIGLQERK